MSEPSGRDEHDDSISGAGCTRKRSKQMGLGSRRSHWEVQGSNAKRDQPPESAPVRSRWQDLFARERVLHPIQPHSHFLALRALIRWMSAGNTHCFFHLPLAEPNTSPARSRPKPRATEESRLIGGIHRSYGALCEARDSALLFVAAAMIGCELPRGRSQPPHQRSIATGGSR